MPYAEAIVPEVEYSIHFIEVEVLELRKILEVSLCTVMEVVELALVQE